MYKSLNTQCNLTKFSTLIVNEYYQLNSTQQRTTDADV